VNIFLACECPISQKYVPLLNSLYSKYKTDPAFKWKFIVPGKVSKTEISTFIREFDVQFPIEPDRRQIKVNELHAGTTPQVVIVTDSIVYSGAIDNWFFELGKYRRAATEHYLVDALESIKDGRLPAIRETEAIGCPIAIAH
jgi:hypothetical protein